MATRKFDETDRGRDPPRGRPPQGRPDDPRHGVVAARHRQDGPGRGVRHRRRGPRGRGGRRRHRRRRRPHRPGRGRLPRLRRGDRHPRPDGQGRQARPHARPAWPDAEPEDRHRHQRGGQDRRRVQGGQGRVPHRPLRQRARAGRQGELRDAGAARELPRGARRAAAGQAGRLEGPVHPVGHGQLHDGPRACTSTRRSPGSKRLRRCPRSTISRPQPNLPQTSGLSRGNGHHPVTRRIGPPDEAPSRTGRPACLR